ncbi:MAG: DUF3375 domain-containing protein [Thermodesulfobacteriota bacterium]
MVIKKEKSEEFDYFRLSDLKKYNPVWRLLQADNSPLIISFFYRVFIEPNKRTLSRSVLAASLEDYLYYIRMHEEDSYPKNPEAYLDDWADDSRGWLRKFYPADSDEVHYDLMPSVEKVVVWLKSLGERSFVGTESRLRSIFEILREIAAGTEKDYETKLEELQKRKKDIENQIELVKSGDFDLLDNTSVRERFQLFETSSRELLSDFREVEYNLRALDRNVREKIAGWEGGKGELLEEFFQEKDIISDSDQGRSFNAFWDLLMSPEKQDELSDLLEKVFEIDAVKKMEPEKRLKRIHYDWLDAGEYTQKIVAKLSSQLRRYLDDHAYMENRRIIQILKNIENKAINLKEKIPDKNFITMELSFPEIFLPMERPMYKVKYDSIIKEQPEAADESLIPSDLLYSMVSVDKTRLKKIISEKLRYKEQVSLNEILNENPLKEGLAELVAYLSIASDDKKAFFDESKHNEVFWSDKNNKLKKTNIPSVIFSR